MPPCLESQLEAAQEAKDRGNKAFRAKVQAAGSLSPLPPPPPSQGLEAVTPANNVDKKPPSLTDYRQALVCYGECLQSLGDEESKASVDASDGEGEKSSGSGLQQNHAVGPAGNLRETALCNRAMANLKVGNHSKALEDCEALDGSGNVKALYRGALAAMSLGRVAQAGDFLQRLLAVSPEDEDALQLQRIWTEDHMWDTAAHSVAKGRAEDRGIDKLLADLVDDCGDVDISTALGQLRDILLQDEDTAELCNQFFSSRGFPVVLSFLSEEYHSEAAAVLLATGGGEDGVTPLGVCRWPEQAIKQLCGRVTGNTLKDEPLPTTAALGVLTKFARCSRTSWAIADSDCCHAVVTALQEAASSSKRPWLSSTAAKAAAEFLHALARSGDPWMRVMDAVGGEGIGSMSLLLLKAYRGSPRFPGTELLPPGMKMPPSDPSELHSQEEVLAFLEYERNKVYNRPLLAVRKAMLGALPAVIAQGDSGVIAVLPDGCTALVNIAATCLSELAMILQDLHASSPSTSRAELGIDGTCSSFTMQKYAADFLANPGGDIITKLPDNVSEMLGSGKLQEKLSTKTSPPAASQAAEKSTQADGGADATLIELCLDAMAQALTYAGTIATDVQRSVLDSLEPLAGYYMSPGVLKRLVSVHIAFSTIKGASKFQNQVTSPTSAIGWACGKRSGRMASLLNLAAAIDQFSGSDFAWMVEDEGGLYILDSALRSPGQKLEDMQCNSKALYDATSKVFEQCLRRAHKYKMSAKVHQIKTMHQFWLSEGIDLTSHQPAKLPRSTEQAKRTTGRVQAVSAGGGGAENAVGRTEETTDEDGCREVFDSSPDEATRRRRNEWRMETLPNALSWHQTSTDIHVSVAVPGATRAKSLTVDIRPGNLRIGLDWFGTLYDGDLYCRVKASEATWTLSSGELAIFLPKENSEDLWRALFKGDNEKGHYEVLQEMVAADDVHVNYDDIPLESKALIEEIQERQAMVCDGLLDLENSFDDFRVVLGDN